jgi:hypothetical protein
LEIEFEIICWHKITDAMIINKGKNNLSSFIVADFIIVVWTEKSHPHSFFAGNSRFRCRLTSGTVSNNARTILFRYQPPLLNICMVPSLQAKPITADTGESVFDNRLLALD